MNLPVLRKHPVVEFGALHVAERRLADLAGLRANIRSDVQVRRFTFIVENSFLSFSEQLRVDTTALNSIVRRVSHAFTFVPRKRIVRSG